MKISDTISVNPSKNTLGHAETTTSTVFRKQVLGAEPSAHSIDILKLAFPSSLAGNSELRKYEVPLRTLMATILIITGLTMLTVPFGIHGTGFAICTLSFGAFLALGLFTRPVMLGASVFYCICGALALRSGTADMTVFALMFGCLIFGIAGAGKYSFDTMILKTIKHHKIKVQKKLQQNMLGYKAFHQAKF